MAVSTEGYLIPTSALARTTRSISGPALTGYQGEARQRTASTRESDGSISISRFDYAAIAIVKWRPLDLCDFPHDEASPTVHCGKDIGEDIAVIARLADRQQISYLTNRVPRSESRPGLSGNVPHGDVEIPAPQANHPAIPDGIAKILGLPQGQRERHHDRPSLRATKTVDETAAVGGRQEHSGKNPSCQPVTGGHSCAAPGQLTAAGCVCDQWTV